MPKYNVFIGRQRPRGFPPDSMSQVFRVAVAVCCLALFFAGEALTLHTPLEWYEASPYDLNFNKLDDMLEALPDKQEPEVYVCFKYDCRPDTLISLILGMGGELGYASPIIASVAVRGLTVSQLENVVAAWDEVGWIVPIGDVQLFMNTAGEALGAHIGHYSPNTAEDRGLDGTGVTIFIVDSGVDDAGHPDLPAAVTGVQVTNSWTGTLTIVNPADGDANGHGTHVAGIALGRGDASGDNRGIAPAADLVDCRVRDAGGTIHANGIQAVVDWIRLNHASITTGPCVANLSVGNNQEASAGHPVAQSLTALVSSGVTVCVAAGNHDNCANDGFGNTAGIGYTAVSPYVITVAAASHEGTIDRSNDVIADYSRVGPGIGPEPKPDITAYGNQCTHQCPANCNTMFPITHNIITTNTLSGYDGFGGTSSASPMVAGACALLLEMNPAMSPQAVKTLLLTNAEDFGTPGWDATWGHGLLDLRPITAPTACNLAVTDVSYTPVPANCNSDVYVTVTVTNTGTTPVTVFGVTMEYWYFNPGDPPIRYPLTTSPVMNTGGALNGGLSRSFTESFDLKLVETPLSPHTCFWGIVHTPCDTDPSNNERFVNATLQNLTGDQCKIGPGANPFVVGDTMIVPLRIAHDIPFPIPMTVRMVAEEPLAWGAYLEYQEIRDTVFIVEVDPGECPVEMQLKAFAYEPAEDDSTDITVYAFNEQFDVSGEAHAIFLAREGNCCDTPGDANNDGAVNVSDPVYLINYIFKNGPPPPCPNEGDANNDCAINVGDAVHLINYIFKEGPPPECGCL